jgi:DNA polymerase III subunit epsilon
VLWPSPPWDSVTYWALDLETGGLDVRRDGVLAVGMVPIRRGAVVLGDAYASIIRPDVGYMSAESIQAHQLVPSDIVVAPPLAQVVPEIERRLADGVLLVHNARIDVGFLRRSFRESGRRWPRPRVVDTIDLLVKLQTKQRFLDSTATSRTPVLNLAAARRDLGLPDYAAHDALMDAIATAELFLVLRRRLHVRTLRDLR